MSAAWRSDLWNTISNFQYLRPLQAIEKEEYVTEVPNSLLREGIDTSDR